VVGVSGNIAIDVAAFLAALEAAGCQPRQIGPGVWLAICPACRLEGRFSLMEVRLLPHGDVALGDCEAA
jgi:hypothetical protein